MQIENKCMATTDRRTIMEEITEKLTPYQRNPTQTERLERTPLTR